MSRKRAGRKSWATRVRYNRAVATAVQEIAGLRFKYLNDVTDAMQIERAWDGKTETISFGRAYAELEGWSGRSFTIISDLGFSDTLVEMFKQNSVICTKKARYRLIR